MKKTVFLFRKHIAFFVLPLLILSSALRGGRRSYQRRKPSQTYYIRVLLDNKPENGPLWQLSSTSGFIITNIQKGTTPQIMRSSKITISARSYEILLNDQRIPSDCVKIEATQGNIRYGSNEYKGSFFVIKKDTKIYLVNRIELEEYVDSGLRWEMIPGWPLAALEAGAIAYRSYVTHTLMKVRNKSKKFPAKTPIYDICCTPVHQSYKGTHSCSSIHQAVKNTKGLVLAYNKEPILALYDACCGGSIPARRSGVDFDKAPYLARFYGCTYCKKCKYYEWSKNYSLKELGTLLSPALSKKGPITDIKIQSADRAGVIQEVKVKVGGHWITLQGSKLPLLAKNIKSCSFTIHKRGNVIRFVGSGYGHQLGFCQWGARGLAERNWSYKRILRFYYPLTKLMKVQ